MRSVSLDKAFYSKSRDTANYAERRTPSNSRRNPRGSTVRHAQAINEFCVRLMTDTAPSRIRAPEPDGFFALKRKKCSSAAVTVPTYQVTRARRTNGSHRAPPSSSRSRSRVASVSAGARSAARCAAISIAARRGTDSGRGADTSAAGSLDVRTADKDTPRMRSASGSLTVHPLRPVTPEVRSVVREYLLTELAIIATTLLRRAGEQASTPNAAGTGSLITRSDERRARLRPDSENGYVPIPALRPRSEAVRQRPRTSPRGPRRDA